MMTNNARAMRGLDDHGAPIPSYAIRLRRQRPAR